MLIDAQLDKVKVKRSFSKAVHSYDEMAGLQRTVGLELLQLYQEGNLSKTILDIGCGTGFLTGELLALLGDKKLIAFDLALPMVRETQTKYKDSTTVRYLCGDAEQLPLKTASINQVFSNVALQWCQNLAMVFGEIKRVLTPNGRLVFSTFGEQTLHELKTAWADVDDFTHVNNFYNAQQIKARLTALGYTDISTKTVIYKSSYESVMALMRELKGIGAHNVTAGRNLNMTTKAQLQQMIRSYEMRMKMVRIYATFEIIYVCAKI